MPSLRTTLIAAVLSTAIAPAWGHGKAHVHGVMSLDIAIEGSTVAVMLRSPQDNLVGHEREPRSAAEKRAASETLALLRDGMRWLQPDAAAQCSAGPVQLSPGRLEGASARSEHADVEAQLEWRCAMPSALKGIEVRLLQAFPRTERIEVQVAGGQAEARQQLRRKNTRVRLVR
jgi:hypothetical protein